MAATGRFSARYVSTVIACDKREAFAQGSVSDEAIQLAYEANKKSWIASLRSQ
jgi:hypothetical protein